VNSYGRWGRQQLQGPPWRNYDRIVALKAKYARRISSAHQNIRPLHHKRIKPLRSSVPQRAFLERSLVHGRKPERWMAWTRARSLRSSPRKWSATVDMEVDETGRSRVV